MLDISPRVLPLLTPGHPPPSRTLRLPRHLCRNTPPPVRSTLFRRRPIRQRKPKSMGGTTTEILRPARLLSLDVRIRMRGRSHTTFPCRFPVVPPGHHERPSFIMRKLFTPILFFLDADADSYLSNDFSRTLTSSVVTFQ